MGKVSLNINGRAYGLGCEDGEEERLTRLGQRLDERVSAMADQFGQIGDLRLLVMAGITLLDEMDDPNNPGQARAESEAKAAEANAKRAEQARARSESEAVDRLNQAADRIRQLAERLSNPG